MKDGFDYALQESPYVFLQWKGTDACLDFHCDCGAFCHFDGDFAYILQCPHCGQAWEMPYFLYPRKTDDPDGRAKTMDKDEDYGWITNDNPS